MSATTDDARTRLRELLGLDRLDRVADPTADPLSDPGTDAPADAGGAGSARVLLEAGELPAPGVPLETRVLRADGTAIPAHLLRPAPEDDLGAGVVLVAGHGNGIDDLVDPADAYHHGLAHQMAAAGFTVLCPEMVSFGRRRVPRPASAEPYGPGENSCGIDAARHLLHGVPVMGRRVADAAAAAEALGALPGVDPRRVAVAGGSGGGAVALLLAAADETVAGALVATYFSSFAASLAAIRHCPCNIVPGLLPELEMAEIAALVAPRPLILEAGERDAIFPIAAARDSYARLVASWGRGRAEAERGDLPALVVTPEGHRFVGERSVELLSERLEGRAAA
ncbi:dienelactone hydrolase family protein [Brachybacterium sp. YJGR34]|uniref:dienelactone hydrolase family protein n=1 Tax=Brachybacterium sp. YJGR34 TaxID=2059911 RepID=UPI000E0C0120|nr:dienelactone hydrolase family protein [Brachybacterium sp. YJGR34]